MVSQMS